MSGIKIKPADRWFSKCIRERSNWTCDVCHKQYEENSMGLHCSHYFSRRHRAVRYDPDNVTSMCYGCHNRLGGDPDDFRRWMVERVGEGLIDILREKRDDVMLAKTCKKNEPDIAKHYQEEFKRLKQLRADGHAGRLEVRSYC